MRTLLVYAAIVIAVGVGVGRVISGSLQSGLEVNQKPEPTPSTSAPEPVTGLPSGLSGITSLHYEDCLYCHLPHLARSDHRFVQHVFVRLQVSETEDYETCVLAVVNMLRKYSSGAMKPHLVTK